MQKKRFLFFLIVLFNSLRLDAQTYGNEWINFSQKYLKIRVSSKGLYGISAKEIKQSGLATQNINPHKFQLFNKGNKVPFFITGSEDNFFDDTDKIVFFGKPNDALLDRALYSDQNHLPNEEMSLFEDDNYYFLTYNESGTDGLRYEQSSISSSGLTPEDHIIYKSRVNFSNNYYPGEYILEAMSLSEYIEGEGYMGPLFALKSNTDYNLNTSSYTVASEIQPQLSFYVAGRSNAKSTAIGANNHHLKISISSTSVFDTVYKGYAIVKKTIPIGNINSENTVVTLSSVDDLGAETDYQAPSYLEIKYPRNLNLNNSIREIGFSINNSKANSLLSFSNANISQPILLDLTSSTYFNATVNGNNLQFVVNNNQLQKNYFLGDLANLKTPISIENITFRNFNIDDIKSFIIISNKSLESGVNSYLNYNRTIRNLQSTIAYVEDLYNEFYYGFHHPLALKNFCAWALNKATTKPEYLLLLGKGYEIPKNNLEVNLVPTYGYPASDNLLTAGINNTTTEPALSTGRLPVTNNIEIENYLNKLRTYEQLPDSLWRKKIIHVTGGRSSSENSSFKNYLNNLYNIAKGEYFGATVINFNKSVSAPVTESMTDGIIRETRKGTALVSFLGHGSTSTTEVSLGAAPTINNAKKPTIYLVNGCSTGNSFTSTISYGEQFILEKDYGAVGWIGTTSEGVASYLYSFSNNFYKNWFNTSYSKSVAFGLRQGIKASTNKSDRLSMAHSRQYILLGDPYLKFMSSEKPDYAMEQNSIYLSPPNQNASQENLKFDFVVRNHGKAVNDSLDVKIIRTASSNSIITSDIFKIKPIYNIDTIKAELSNIGHNITGGNKITISLDPHNEHEELNKINNHYEYPFFLTGNGVNPIFPIKNSITNEFILKAQPDNLFTTNTKYIFEIDTVSTFDSSFKLTSGNISADLLPEWKPNITPENNKVYFWRVKIINDENIDNWQTSSFLYVVNNESGFNISHKDQIIGSELKNNYITYDNGGFKFGDLILNAAITTRGDDVSNTSSDRRLRVNNSAVSWWPSERNGITMVSYSDKDYNSIFNYPSSYNSWDGPNPINGYVGQFYWDTNIQQDLDSMLVYLNQIPDGYYVIGFNNLNLNLSELPNNIKQALKNLGLSKFQSVSLGEPYMFFGKKGSAEGSALEITANYESTISARSQTLIYSHDIKYSNDNGDITSPKIGPVKEWKNAQISFSARPSDELSYTIIGVTKNGTESVVRNSSVNSIDISDIDPVNYPYIRLKTNIKNTELRTVPSFKHWKVFYTPVTELTFNPTIKNSFYANSLLVGDSISVEMGLSNISKQQDSDSIKISYNIRKQNNSVTSKSFKVAPLAMNGSSQFKIKESTIDLAGKNILSINLENTGYGDNYNFNNTISYDFEVAGDNQEPKIDILFDGKRIVNGEIVSPSPIIDIASIDNNTILLQSDTSLINIYIKEENEANYKRINFSDSKLNIIQTGNSSDNRLVVRYTPDKLNNGKYTLKVSSKDFLGNSSQNDFLTEFEVINESTISHFYPYPNPVINSMRFVFTLTGNKIPDKLKIQILNQSGKVVREILKGELGNLKIGNNVSDFVWDCKDQFGDRLANGVYFYRVFIEDSSEDFKHRYTRGDTNFKNNIGKIYLIK